MNTQHWLGSLLILITMVWLGCESDRTPPAIPREGQQVPILREFRGQQGPFPDRSFLVVQRPEVWEALWTPMQVPDVDFSRQTALVALMGRQPTAGYDIRIVDVRATGQSIVAYVQETRPAPGTPVAQVISYPYHIVLIPKVTQPVSFVLTEGGATPIVTIVDAFQGLYSNAVNPQTVVIREQLAWSRFWAETFGAGVAAPQIDFAQNMAVAVLLGRRPTGGYTVTITAVERIDDRLVVHYRTRSPQPGEVVTQAQTSPYAIAIVPTSPLPVTFRNTQPLPAAAAAPLAP